MIKLDPSTGVRLLVNAQVGDARPPEEISLDMEFVEEARVLLRGAPARSNSATAEALHPAGRGVEEAWRVFEPLIDSPPGAPVREGIVGPRWPTNLAAAHGGWRGPWLHER